MPRRIVIFLLTLLFVMPMTAQDNPSAQTIFSSELLNADNKIPIGEYGTLVFKFAAISVMSTVSPPSSPLTFTGSVAQNLGNTESRVFPFPSRTPRFPPNRLWSPSMNAIILMPPTRRAPSSASLNSIRPSSTLTRLSPSP